MNGFPEQIGPGEMLWVDAESPTDKELADLKQRFGLDEYAVEDVIRRNQRPKMEDYGKNVFAVIHVPVVKSHRSEIIELFVFFQKNWIITIHSVDSELIRAVDARIRARGLSPLTTNPSPDLLFYIFLDFAVDEYYPILDEVENRLEELDKQAVTTFKTRVKRMENIVGMVMRGAVPFVADASLRSFRDVYDHSFQLLETIDNDRDRTSDVRDLYISLHSASTDNTIKVLTLVATIFLPLTLLAGIYGMNFSAGFFQPGSGDPLGFYVMILAMIIVSLGFVYMFKRSGWI